MYISLCFHAFPPTHLFSFFFLLFCSAKTVCGPWPRGYKGYKAFSILSSDKHESVNNHWNSISWINFMLSTAGQEKNLKLLVFKYLLAGQTSCSAEMSTEQVNYLWHRLYLDEIAGMHPLNT